MVWQVQEAKQRFSEVLRRVETEGDQIVTRHGSEVAAVIDIAEYRRLRALEANLSAAAHPGLFPPLADDEYAGLVEAITADRATAAHRPGADFGDA
jgi:prevent-host-death family protein